MITIAVVNQKGGVGKTTIAFNLSQILAARRNTNVLAVDNDPQGNLTLSFLKSLAELNSNILGAYEGKFLVPEKVTKNLSILGADITLAPVAERDFQVIFKLKEALETINTDSSYDFCVIDCLPSFGHLHLSALTAADYALIAVKPAPYALAGMAELLTTIEKAKQYFNSDLKILGIVINQFDGRKPVMEREMEEALRETYGDLVFKAKINKRVKVEESPAFQKSITDYDPKGPASYEFRALVREILRRINNDK